MMTETELTQLMYAALTYADRNFEFWISASFAVVLAFHFSAKSLTPMLYRLITFLYCSATVLFISRWLVAALQYASFRRQLIEMDTSINLSGNLIEGVITIAYAIVMLIGTISTLYFGRRTMRKAKNPEPE